MAYAGAHRIRLEFVCKPYKDIPFIGCDALLARKTESHGPYSCFLIYPNPLRLRFACFERWIVRLARNSLRSAAAHAL
jgi:hypothetical protein